MNPPEFIDIKKIEKLKIEIKFQFRIIKQAFINLYIPIKQRYFVRNTILRNILYNKSDE